MAMGADPAPSLNGLTDAEVETRRAQYGFNEVTVGKPSEIIKFLKKFWGLTSWALEIAAIVSLALRNWTQAGVILFLLVVNALISYFQERRAANAVEALKQSLQLTARVLRNGKWGLLPARELLPGDLVRLRQGDVIAADMTLCDADASLSVDQSALTGESIAVEAKQGSDVFSGSVVRMGESRAVVTAIGASTKFGQTVELVASSTPKLHIQTIMFRVAWALLGIGGVLVLILAIDLIADSSNRPNFVQQIPLLIGLLVSALPVALPAMFTLTMALGSSTLSRKGVLVSRLPCTIDAAGMSVLCSDKTGTITSNHLAVSAKQTFGGFTEQQLLQYALMCSKPENHDPIDVAVAEGQIGDAIRFEQLTFSPFDAHNRRTEARLRLADGGKEITARKGAVNTVVADCGLSAEEARLVEQMVAEYAAVGHRALAVSVQLPEEAKKEDNMAEKKKRKKEKAPEAQGKLLEPIEQAVPRFRLVGLLGFSDPPREDSAAVLEEIRRLGIRVIMITGDAQAIAAQVAKQVGLQGPVQSLGEWHTNKKNGDEVPDVDNAAVYAEVFPADKHTIVKSLQRRGLLVGMTGDGVNDAPALKQAEVGVAVDNATDVAKAAASAVMLKPGLAGVPALVRAGRKIHRRLSTWVLNKVIKTITTILFVVAAYFGYGKLVVDPLNLFTLVLLVDFVTLALATDNARSAPLPCVWQIPRMVVIALFVSLAVVAEALALLAVGVQWMGLNGNIGQIYTFSFEILFFFGNLSCLLVRDEHFWSSRPSWLLLGVLLVDAVLVVVLSSVGVSWLALERIPFWYTAVVVGWSVFFALGINTLVIYFARHVLTGPPRFGGRRRQRDLEMGSVGAQ